MQNLDLKEVFNVWLTPYVGHMKITSLMVEKDSPPPQVDEQSTELNQRHSVSGR